MSAVASPAVAAALSFILPGLGQVAEGSLRRGLLLAIPAVAVFAVGVGLLVAGPGTIVDLLLRREVLIAILVANAVLGAYHLLAIADAFQLGIRRRSMRRRLRRSSAIALATLLTMTLGIHAGLEAVGYQAYWTLESVFVPSGPDGGWSIPEPSFTPSPEPSSTPTPRPSPSRTPAVSPSPTPAPTPTPTPAPAWAADGRLNVLLIGSDAGPDRWSLRTDTMILLSIDVATGRAALFGIPRNMVGVPLAPESAGAFPNGRFPGLLNALYVYAMGHPAHFPGNEARGFRAVTGAVQELVGVRLDSAVVVNLAGFVRLVNAIGGLWIDVPERVVDRNYPLEDGSGYLSLDIRPGCQLLDGRMALAYARSRHQDSDYGRMRRQQAVLVALARQVDPIALLPKVPELLDIARNNLWTTIRRDEIRGLAELADRVDTSRVASVRFVPPTYPTHLTSGEINRIRSVVRSIFDAPGAGSGGSPRPTEAPPTCP